MAPESPAPAVSKKMLWSGRVMSAVPVLLLLMSAAAKFAKPPSVTDGFVRMGIPLSMVTGLGILEVLCTVVYLVPRTSILGAILVTGYLGGATLATVRVADSTYLMPAILGVLAWGGLYLREPRLRALIPFRR